MASFFDQLVGTKPKVPELPVLDLGTEQQKAIDSNLKNLSKDEQLAGSANLFNQQQIDAMLARAIPGWQGISAGISSNIASEAAGQIPKDVSDAVQNNAAARSLSGGFSGSGAGGALLAKDLGLTSLDLTARGLSSAEAWSKSMASMYEPGQMNLTSMFITPGQQAGFDVEERNMQFQRSWLENQIKAMPAPWAEDLKQFVYRAMSVYSGTSVPDNPYSKPGSFGGLGGGGGGGMTFGSGNYGYSPGAGEGGAGFDPGSGGGGADVAGELGI